MINLISRKNTRLPLAANCSFLANLNFQKDITTKVKNTSISLTKRNFTEDNDKKQIIDDKDLYVDHLKKNQEYYANDNQYLQRVIKIERTLTPEEQIASQTVYNNIQSKIKAKLFEKTQKPEKEKQKAAAKEDSIIITEYHKPEEFLKKIIKETSNKKLSDYISEEQREGAEEKYKEINYNYFKQKEVYTRAQIYGVKSKINKASAADPEWGTNLHRKFLQRNFLKRNNFLYDLDNKQKLKEPFDIDDKKINYNFLKSLKLDEPILIYESFLKSLKPMISAKRHFIAYGLMLPYAYSMFFFNYEFLFSMKMHWNLPHVLTNATFIGFMYNYNLMRYYNRALVTQIKYNGKADSVLLYTHRGFNNGVLEVEHQVADLFGFKKASWITGDYIYIKSRKKPNILYLVPMKGIFHEREAFENIFGLIIDDSEEIEKKNNDQRERRLFNEDAAKEVQQENLMNVDINVSGEKGKTDEVCNEAIGQSNKKVKEKE